MHIFSKGPYGLSLADETWADVKKMILSQKALFTGQIKSKKNHAWNEIMSWPQIASEWIRNLIV